MKLHTDSPQLEDMLYRFRGQKVKGQGHSALKTENGFCCIIAFPLHL